MSASTGLEIERKYLLREPDLSAPELADAELIQITQQQLLAEKGSRRVRRSERADGSVRYHLTEKRRISGLVREEREREIDASEYERLLAERDPAAQPLRKTRIVFKWEGFIFELDCFAAPHRLYMLEVELEDEHVEVAPPPFLPVVAEVTGDRRFTSSKLAAAGAADVADALGEYGL